MYIATLAIFASGIALATATVFVKAPCPATKTVADFNLNAYKGVWYEVARYPDDWEKKGDCGKMDYRENNSFNLTNVVDGKLFSILGTIRTEGGLLYHDSSDFTKPEGSSLIPVNIVAVDYDKYSIVYECKYNEATKTRHDFCWILTRNRNKKDEVINQIADIIKSLGFIDKSKLVWSHLTKEVCLE